MKEVEMGHQDLKVQEFIQSLPIDKEGCILAWDGRPLLKVVPIKEVRVDKARLKAAILNRRDESRRLNAEWEAVDREMWDKLGEYEE